WSEMPPSGSALHVEDFRSADGSDRHPDRCAPYKELANSRAAESSEMIRTRVIAARNVQFRRFYDEKIYTNAQMGPRHIRSHCVLTTECEKIMENAVTRLGFSDRGYDRILKINRISAGPGKHEK